jgi:probable HAF family extracellular repeat protein
MKRLSHKVSLAILVLFICLAAAEQSFGIQYTIVDLGTLGGTSSWANDINNSGQVVGRSYIAGKEVYHAFLYNGGVMQDLGYIGDIGGSSIAFGINDSAQVVGTVNYWPSRYSLPVGHAFIYSDGVMQDIGTLGDFFSDISNALDVNNLGQVVGNSYIGYIWRPFLYNDGVMQDIGTLGGTYGQALGINDSGQVVGASYIVGDAVSHAFLYSGRVMQDIGTLGGTKSIGFKINNSGQVVGASDITGDTVSHAFLYSDGVMQDLGTLGGSKSFAYTINDSGQVVGVSDISGNTGSHAFIYSDGVMQDLNALLPSSSGWILTTATGINDKGQIVGSGLINGETHAFLMSPLITPSQQVDNTLSFIEESVSAGTLEGGGPGNSGQGRLNALTNMIEAAGQLISEGDIAGACEQLLAAYKKTDGSPKPPDVVGGEAASELAAMIQKIITTLGCN